MLYLDYSPDYGEFSHSDRKWRRPISHPGRNKQQLAGMSRENTSFGYLVFYRLDKVEMGLVLRELASEYRCGECL